MTPRGNPVVAQDEPPGTKGKEGGAAADGAVVAAFADLREIALAADRAAIAAAFAELRAHCGETGK